MARRGPRGGSEDTRAAILEAARKAFGSSGYDRATIRAIAADAGVDPALVHHYFGTKGDLFAAAMALPFRPADAVGGILQDSPGDVGTALARLFFSAWETSATRDALLGQLRHSMVTGEQPAMAGFLSEELLGRLAEVVGGDDAEIRVELAAAHLIGTAILRYVVRLEPLASAPVDVLVEELGPYLQERLGSGRPD